MAIKRFSFLWYFGFMIIVMSALVMIWHTDLILVVRIFVISFGVLFALLVADYLYTKRNQIIDMIGGRDE